MRVTKLIDSFVIIIYSIVLIVVLLIPEADLTIKLNLSHAGPSWNFPLGNDALGRSYLNLILVAIKETVPLLWLVSSIALILGWILGITIQCGNLIPKPVRYLTSLACSSLNGIPFFISIFFSMIILGNIGIHSILWGLAFVFFLQGCSQISLLAAGSKHLLFWDVHRSLGGRPLHRLVKYGLLGAWKAELWQQWRMSLQMAIIAEMALSYMGLGVQEPYISLGLILSEQMAQYLSGQMLFALLGLILSFIFIVRLTAIPARLFDKSD